MDQWVPVAAAAVGAVPGLLTARWSLRRSDRDRRDDLLRAAVANLLTQATAAAIRQSFVNNPDVLRVMRWRPGRALEHADSVQTRLAALMAAKAEFDLLVDTQGLHDAADALLEAVIRVASPEPGVDAADDAADVHQAAMAALKEARLNLIHGVRAVMPGIVSERRRWWSVRRVTGPTTKALR